MTSQSTVPATTAAATAPAAYIAFLLTFVVAFLALAVVLLSAATQNLSAQSAVLCLTGGVFTLAFALYLVSLVRHESRA